MVLGEQNQQIAEALGIEEPMFYVPRCDSGRLSRGVRLRVKLSAVTKLKSIQIPQHSDNQNTCSC